MLFELEVIAAGPRKPGVMKSSPNIGSMLRPAEEDDDLEEELGDNEDRDDHQNAAVSGTPCARVALNGSAILSHVVREFQFIGKDKHEDEQADDQHALQVAVAAEVYPCFCIKPSELIAPMENGERRQNDENDFCCLSERVRGHLSSANADATFANAAAALHLALAVASCTVSELPGEDEDMARPLKYRWRLI